MDDTGRVLSRAQELAAELPDGTCVTPAVWHDRAVQCCAVSNWSTTESDVDRTIEGVRRVVSGL